MDTAEISPAVAAPDTPEDLVRRHRATWAEAVCGSVPALDLGAEGDPVSALEAALEEGADQQAVLWVDAEPSEGLEELLRAAAEAGWRIALTVRADAHRFGSREAHALAEALGGTVLVQRLAGPSLIHAPDAPPAKVEADMQESPVADLEDASAWLIAANVPADELEAATGTIASPAVTLVHSVYLQRLEAANASLRRANTRLAREHLGRHDSAAASVLWKLERALAESTAEVEQLKARLETEMEVARRNDEYFQDARRTLMKRPHRFVSGLERRFGRVPLLKRLFR